MSLTIITKHDENINRILDKSPPEPPPSPRYISKLERELKAYKKPPRWATFGFPKTPLRGPNQFLRKGQGIGQPVKKSDHKCIDTGNLPAVPRRPPPSKAPPTPKKNFRVLNIKKVVKAKPRPIEPRIVDSRNGDLKNLKGSGEIPEYCRRPDFGRLPQYLIRRNKKLMKQITMERIAEENRKSLCTMVSQEEREKLLADLKHNWSEMQTAYLQLPMVTDTRTKLLRKLKLEKDLQAIEKDIELVQSHPYIYIFDEDNL